MRIQHNIMAMNAYRNYTTNTSALSKNLEKLSSGYRINRAGDDAAGLAISEKMRAQITALGAASKNVKDGISLVKTAEGATQEIHDMLNRMVNLATQSANGTYQDEVDREAIEDEFNALKTEINRIADSSNFNGIKLLDGSLEDKIAVAAEQNMTITAKLDGKESDSPVLGEFVLDLSQASWSSTVANSTVKFELGGTELDLDAADTTKKVLTIAKDQTFTGKDVADKIYDGLGANHEFTDASGNVYTVTNDKAGKLTFTQKVGKDLVETASALNLTLTDTNGFKIAADGTVTNGIKYNQGGVQAVTVTKNGVADGGRLYAQAEFTLGADQVKDGGTLTIGDTTYVFAVGKDSKYKDQANVVDLTDKSITDTDLAKQAAQRLSAVAEGNKNFFVETDADSAKVLLTEKEGGVDYSKYNLTGADGLATHDKGYTAPDADWTGLVKYGTIDAAKSTKGLMLQIGEDSESYNQLKVSVQDMHTAALGLDGLTLGTQEGAQKAVQSIKDAINSVSSTRGKLGATQNRLEHTSNNLSVMKENIQDAESTIRDTDVAEEMMAYTKNNILVQSAQAMLAQANQIPQGVLQLLG